MNDIPISKPKLIPIQFGASKMGVKLGEVKEGWNP
jgi:hypothetical protein